MKLAMKRTPAELARCYQEVDAKIKEAYRILIEARELYKTIYDDKFDPVPKGSPIVEYALEGIRQDLKRRSWSRIIDLMQVKRISSSQRWDEIIDKLYKRGEDVMPDITEMEIISMYQGFVQNAKSILAEAVQEVYDFLSPGRSRSNKHKTNKPDEIGEKVVLVGILDTEWMGRIRISHWYEQKIMNLDRVIHILDGESERFYSDYRSPLVSAIDESPMEGETQYFAWRGYMNGNLHLTIKRRDLVDEMSLILRESVLGQGHL